MIRLHAQDLNTMMLEYVNDKEDYDAFADKLKILLSELLDAAGIKYHSIVSRTKDSESLYQKVLRQPNKYRSLKDVHDLTGIRIVTYFHDDVREAARIIENEFSIDRDQSVDKSTLLDTTEFGYLSVHFVAALSEQRLALSEYGRFKSHTAEIQIRSILQHAWAEIEHDLGYKNPNSVPAEVRRSFSRVAGLLEIADQEFVNIKKQLKQFEDETVQQILSDPHKVRITSDNLNYFIDHSPVIGELDKRLVTSQMMLDSDQQLINELIRMFHYVDIRNYGELIDAVSSHSTLALKCAQVMPNPFLPRQGIGIAYICMAVTIAGNDAHRIDYFFRRFYPELRNVTEIISQVQPPHDEMIQEKNID
ncbi:(p)ppGpp synthetase [Exiguobacterium sp. s193]|uniref:GTP pyrophosphokinase n=1 Tax=Exiguobacterium sp. s193 TaxID=2751207 RepID=UPI003339AFA4